MPKITVFHLNNSRSQRIIWLLEELGCDYEIINSSKVDASTLPAHIKPLKFPTIKTTDLDETHYLSETSAICEYLPLVSNNLTPPEEIESLTKFIYWRNFADCSFMPNLELKQVFAQIVERSPVLLKLTCWVFKDGVNRLYLEKTIADKLRKINEHLATNTWLSGDEFTTADILNWFPLQASIYATKKDFNYPHIIRYLGQINNRQAFKDALTKGDWSDEQFTKYWLKTR